MVKSSKDRTSIIIPVYNEEGIINSQLKKIYQEINNLSDNFEILVIENGSNDRTRELLSDISKSIKEIVMLCVEKPDYGRAMKVGIENASGDIIHICQIDYFEIDFFKKSLDMIYRGDVIVCGSRTKKGFDRRPLQRRLLTIGLNVLLKIMFKYKGTDAHGLKTFRRKDIIPFIHKSKMTRGVFDTELLLRAQFDGVNIVELPVRAYEMRKKRNTYLQKLARNINDLIIMRKLFNNEKLI